MKAWLMIGWGTVLIGWGTLLLTGCTGTAEDSGADTDSAAQPPADISGDWEGVCVISDTTIDLDMVLNQEDVTLTGGADVWFTDIDGVLQEFAGAVTGTVTDQTAALDISIEGYGTVSATGTYSDDPEAGERLVGTCSGPLGNGELALSQ